MYKISIVLPLFNDEDYVKNAFDSILNQSIGFENLEVIFVDDCSSDSTASIIQDFAEKYENVKYFLLEENSGGLGKPRNVGIENASADYIMFLNPNDKFEEEACEKLYAEITNDYVDVVSGNFLKISGEKAIKNTWKKLDLQDDRIKFHSIQENPEVLKYPASVWTKIFKKDIIMENNIRFPEGVPSEDFHFVCHYFLKSNGILFVDTITTKHKPKADKKGATSKKDLSDFLRVYNDLYQLFDREDENLKWLASFNLNYWSKLFVFSDLDTSNKIDLLYQAHDLYIEVKNSPNLNYKKGYESFYEKICDKNYYGAVEDAENIRLADSLKSRNVFMVFAGFGLQITSLAKAVFNRANLLSKNGYKNVTLLNIDTFRNENILENFKNFKYRESFFKEREYLDKSVRIINMFDYFSAKNTINFGEKYYSADYLKLTENVGGEIDLLDVDLKLPNKFFIHDKYVIKREVTEDEQVILKYYEKVALRKKINSMYNLDKLIFIKNFSIPKKTTPVKSETYINHSLVVETFYNDNKVDLYTQDGFNYCSISKTDGELLFKLNDRQSSGSYYMNHKEFYEYFILKICLESLQKPFLINDCSGKKPSIADIPSDVAYKISNIHCNHHKNPFTYGSEIKTLGALENLDDLDEMVLLTESQKNDFKKEFDYERVHCIPYFMPDDAMEYTYFDKSDLNKNKISVFSKTESSKNIKDIIKAFKEVVDAKPDARLEIFAKNSRKHETKEYKKLKKLIEKFKIKKNVTFRGGDVDTYKEMVDSLATVITSKTEGFDMVLLESMANCTPVISYDTNYGPSDVIDDDVNGSIVVAGNVTQLSEKILNLLNDPLTAIEMGQEARNKIIENYSEKQTLERWNRLFKQAVVDNENNKDNCKRLHEKLTVEDRLIESNTLLSEENKRLNLNLKTLENKAIKLNEEITKLNKEINDSKNKKSTLKGALNKLH